MKYASRYIAGFLGLGLLGLGINGAVQTQGTRPLLSFEASAIETWIEQKRLENPDGFNEPKCLRSDAFKQEVSTSCLAQQAMFFLSEVNKRRTIEQQALRRTLKATDEKRSVANARAAAAEETLSQAQVSIEMVDELTQKLEALRSQVERSDKETAQLRETNDLLIEVYQSLTNQLHQAVVDSIE